jgi:hypothetical protein
MFGQSHDNASSPAISLSSSVLNGNCFYSGIVKKETRKKCAQAGELFTLCDSEILSEAGSFFG